MNLTEMFYGKFEPYKTENVIVHKIGLAGGHRYIPSKKIKPEFDNRTFEQKLSVAGKIVLKLLRAQTKPITGEMMSKKTSFTRNYCSCIMSMFVKEGLAKRMKVKKPNTNLYAYTAVKND